MPAARHEYWAARWAARYEDRRPVACKGCGAALVQPKRGYRLYCSSQCKSRTWERANYVPVPREVAEPMPMAYVGAPVFEEARRVARLTSTDFSVDWGQNDILGEAVLAILEGRDPDEAVRAHRADEKARAAQRRYVADVGWDGHRVVVQKYGDVTDGMV